MAMEKEVAPEVQQSAPPSPLPQPFVVVLTGGPSAGKSSAMAVLRDRLSVRGFQVLTVPENATHFLANSDGFQPEWAGTKAQVRMQRLFLDYQIAQEEAFKAFAGLHPTKPAVLLLDCCTLNSKVYLTDEQWEQVLNMPGMPVLSEDMLFQRYDLVIHMITCALEGHYEWGPGSNNPGRYHSPEQAKETDQRCLELFGSHPQVRVVPHFQRFDDKIRKVLDFVTDALHVEGLAGKRKRVTVRVVCQKRLQEVVSHPGTSSFNVMSTFLDEPMLHSMRRRARMPTESWLAAFQRLGEAPGAAEATPEEALGRLKIPIGVGAADPDVVYERRTKWWSPKDPGQNYLTRKVVKEDDYFATLESVVGGVATTTKRMLNFLLGTSYYELFFFPGYTHPVLDLAEGCPVPSWLELIGGEDDVAADAAAAKADAASGGGGDGGGAGGAKRKAAEAAAAPTAPAEVETDGRNRSKRPRALCRHTTEESAVLNLRKQLIVAPPTAR